MVSHVDQSSFKLMYLRMSLNFFSSSCIYLPSAGTTGMNHQDPGLCDAENWTQASGQAFYTLNLCHAQPFTWILDGFLRMHLKIFNLDIRGGMSITS